jgi:RHS repeat-associated protein
MNSSGTITATNTYGLAGLISRHTTSGSTFYEFDPQGTVVQRLNSAGSNTITSTADAFGNVANSGTVSDPFGYEAQAGYYTDQSTGLILTTFRYYDPGNGRFLNRDPIGSAGGINVYGYCGNNAENGTDPSGLGPAGTPWLGRSHRTDPPLPNGDLLGNDWSIFWDWVFQTGGMNRFYNADDPGTQDLRQEFGAWMSDQYAAAGAPNSFGGSEGTLAAASRTVSDAAFGMPNTTQAYVGGFLWYAHRLKGNKVRYTIYNQLSVESFFYHVVKIPHGGHPDRSDTGIYLMGNINQWFSWTTAVPPTCGKKR